jgi:hypothetical protein
MDASQDSRSPRRLEALLAGLQAGTLGTLWMLAWMGMGSVFLRRTFWAPENLLATVLHPQGEIAAEFTTATVSGLALYLVIYGLLGAGFAFLATRIPTSRARAALLAMVFALAWYYISFHYLWKAMAPLVTLLDLTRTTVVGHLIYGLVLGRFYTYLPRAGAPAGQPAIAVQASAPSAEPAPSPEPRA